MDGGALLQVLPIIFVIYLINLASGTKAAEAEILNVWAAQQTLIAIIPAFIVICMVRAIFYTIKQLRDLGYWYGNTFIYNVPQQVFATTVSSEDNDNVHYFEVKDAPVNSLVNLGFSIDSGHNLVKAQITDNGRAHIDWRGATSIIKSGFRLPKNKKLGLLTKADLEVDPTTVRVYVYSWRVLPNPS